jgi:hypothetical protein
VVGGKVVSGKGLIKQGKTQFIGLAYQGEGYIVFRFIIEYISLMDFGPY